MVLAAVLAAGCNLTQLCGPLLYVFLHILNACLVCWAHIGSCCRQISTLSRGTIRVSGSCQQVNGSVNFEIFIDIGCAF